MSEKLQEATIKALQGKLLNEDISEDNIKEDFCNRILPYIIQNTECEGEIYKGGDLHLYPKDSKWKDKISLDFNCWVDDNNVPYGHIIGGPIYHYSYYETDFYEKDLDKLIDRINKMLEKSKIQAQAIEDRKNKSVDLKWKIISEDPITYHAEKRGYYFNIYTQEDGTFNLIVDYKDYELQDYDDIYDNLDIAKKRAEEIYKEDPGPDYED